MAWNWYLNMEPLSLEIARSHAYQMSDSNFLEEPREGNAIDLMPDNEAFLNNLKLGFVAITMVSCFFESSLNTFLREKLQYNPEGNVIHGSENLKIEILFKDDPVAISAIKVRHEWGSWKSIKCVRNELIHYKNNSPAFMSAWPLLDKWTIGKKSIGYFFTKTNILKSIDDVEMIVNEIAHALDLTVNPHSMILGSDGRCGIGSYYCSKEDAASILADED